MDREALERDVVTVLDRYPLAQPAARSFLGNAGGFSGSRLWKIQSHSSAYCLRAWPLERTSAEQVARIHRWMSAARGQGLLCVPAVVRAADGQTYVEMNERVWDVTEWMTGRADFHASPNARRLESVAHALAEMHRAWAGYESRIDIPFSVTRRIALAADWQALLLSGWRPDFGRADLSAVSAVAQRAWLLLPSFVPQIESGSARWRAAMCLQPCLCDIWHDHVFYDSDSVSAIIDYGAMRLDHPAADLARLLGSLVGDRAGEWKIALDAYRSITRFGEGESALARWLDRTGTVLAAANWLRWLYLENRQYDDLGAVASRLQAIVDRLAGWQRDNSTRILNGS